ncbi:GPI inositol-deacylase [Caerostris extrusa]|uniref:Post-GPI attachment to proteins factor 1 n=1 Tax=Caerostris extrusa TaxID=172846 RepID=A0AAV4VD88_CAEEX|nr:GPI inositol-deacylase [Caerostris extrusa]
MCTLCRKPQKSLYANYSYDLIDLNKSHDAPRWPTSSDHFGNCALMFVTGKRSAALCLGMKEYPEYLKIPLKYDIAQQFQRYNLYVYGEGKYFEELQKGKYLGSPVLFIPGNAGSYRQIRSLASEISGLYGGTLKKQSEFVLACISHIQSLYSSEKKIILIGHSMTSSIPGVWVSTDHLAIVILWMLKIYLDIIICQSSGSHFPQVPLIPVSTFTTSGQWIEQENNAWRFSRSKVLSTIYLLIPVRKNTNVLLVASGIIDILGERYNSNDRTKYVKLPSVIHRAFSPPVKMLSISLSEQSVFYNITISQSYGVFESVELQLETRLCRAGSVVGQGIIKIRIPWSNEISYHHIRTVLGGVTTIPITAYFLPPPNFSHDVIVELILDPECSVALTAKFPLNIVAYQFAKFYAVYIFGYTVALLLALFAGQMRHFEAIGSFSSCITVFGQYPTYITLVVVPSVLYHFILAPELNVAFIPTADEIIQDDNRFISTVILRTLLYLIACGLITVLYIVCVLFLIGISKLWMCLKRKTLLNITEVPMEQALKVKRKISKFQLVWTAFIGAVSLEFSSSLAFTIAFIAYSLKFVSSYIRCAAEIERRGCGCSNQMVLAIYGAAFMDVCILSSISWLNCLVQESSIQSSST